MNRKRSSAPRGGPARVRARYGRFNKSSPGYSGSEHATPAGNPNPIRVAGGKMTYDRQRDDYETAFMQKRLDAMSPEELEALQAELEQEKQDKS